MTKALLLSLLLLGGPGCGRAPPVVQDISGLPALSGRVVDGADLLTPAQEARLSAESEAIEKEVGAQYVVATVPSLNGRPIEDYSIALARHWGLGGKKRNDGLLLLVAPAERKVRIEVGYGLERRVTDPFAGRVIRERALPRFKEGNFPGGIEAASDALFARLRSGASDSEIARRDGVVA
ncbi:MAG: uncharacterized protein QOJ91_1340 [Sphingomonadales bacterium]|nr:uncharacterized protein [Sphingomonadales bacterium]